MKVPTQFSEGVWSQDIGNKKSQDIGNSLARGCAPWEVRHAVEFGVTFGPEDSIRFRLRPLDRLVY
jgi:hypothetical protein